MNRKTRLRVVLVLATGALVAASALASSQSLAEVAKKEKERRDRLSRQAKQSGEGPSPVLSEEDLKASRGDSVSVMGRDSGEVGREPENDEGGTDEVEPERSATSELGAKEIGELRQKWSVLWREQMEEAQKNLEAAEYDRDQCQAASRYFFVPIAIDCDDVPRRLAEAERELAEVRANRYNWELLLPSGGASRR